MKMKRLKLPPQDYLKECFDYDPITGLLVWKERPRHHFPTERGMKTFNSSFVGKPALACVSDRYRNGQLTYNGKKQIFTQHLIIWKWMTGVDPDQEIDHWDKNSTNNIWKNLRESSRSQNMANTSLRKDNGSGYKGVFPKGKKYAAAISHNKKRKWLGVFDTAKEAHEAYIKAAIETYGEFARVL